MAVLVQFIILPYLFPQWHAGGGILIQGDSASWHLEAIQLAQQIKGEGWSVWELRPLNIPPIGVAAAIYALTIPALWTLIPINAALHALASLTLFQIVRNFSVDWRKAWLAVLPFWLYPSALNWYAQLHKDGFTIAGAFLFLFGWVLFAQFLPEKVSFWRLFSAMGIVAAGSLLTWIMRPYVVQLMQFASVIPLIWLTACSIFWVWQKKQFLGKALLSLVLAWGTLFAITPLTHDEQKLLVPISAQRPYSEKTLNREQLSLAKLPRASNKIAAAAVNRISVPLWFISIEILRPTPAPPPPSTPQDRESGWLESGFPTVIEKAAFAVAVHRDYFISIGGLSQLDQEIHFRQVTDILRYIPRAVQIASFAPFPDMWFGEGVLPQTTLMRRLVALEMVANYAFIAMLPLTLHRWWRKPELWVVLIFSLTLIVFFALVVTNIGTLYRYRYGFYMIVVTLGLAGGLSFWKERSKPSA